MVKRFLILAALVGVFVCGLMVFTTQSTSAHGPRLVRGTRLAVLHERRSCEHVVEFVVHERGRHFMQVSGPDRTHPQIVSERGDAVIARYWVRGNECRPDFQHRAYQFTLRIF